MLIAVLSAQAQTASGPGVSVAPVQTVTVQPGKKATVKLTFHVNNGFHINSNQPTSELLIPTTVKVSLPAEMLIGKFAYPPGQEFRLPAMPEEKLNVYSGTFQVSGMVTTTESISPGTYRVHGELKYQACSDRQCFPPRTQPFQFDVKVVRPVSHHYAPNPAQSPHVHG